MFFDVTLVPMSAVCKQAVAVFGLWQAHLVPKQRQARQCSKRVRLEELLRWFAPLCATNRLGWSLLVEVCCLNQYPQFSKKRNNVQVHVSDHQTDEGLLMWVAEVKPSGVKERLHRSKAW